MACPDLALDAEPSRHGRRTATRHVTRRCPCAPKPRPSAPVLRSCKSTLQPVAEPRGHRLRRGAGDTLSQLDSPCFRVAASTMPKVFSMAEYQQMLDRFISARRYPLVTIGAAWIFKGGEGEELWIASDSRLSGDGTDSLGMTVLNCCRCHGVMQWRASREALLRHTPFSCKSPMRLVPIELQLMEL